MEYPDWLSDSVLYQIYPSSFCDSNGDGIGDLNGITSKLDYIRELGADTVWLSPIYDSPFRDGGYDVRDYCAIAERYGTMEDFERLVAETHARGMRLLLDFVPGHTSSEHPWFVNSCKHERNEHSDWYIWTDRTFNADESFNALGTFVNGYAERDGNYMSNFFYFQPALNYGFAEPDPAQPWQLPIDHPSVQALRQEMFRIMRFWLDKGVDGFRVDMAASLVKGTNAAAVQKCMAEFWRDVRSWWDRDYPEALLLAEWSNPSEAIECGFHLDFMIHFGEANGMKPFRGENNRTIIPRNETSYFDRKGAGELHAFWGEFEGHRAYMGDRGFLSIPTGNHDLPRYAVERDATDLKLINTFLFTLPHVPTIYYGDEIGMRNLGELPSKEGGYDRTGARTPMQWDDSANAGFSSGAAEKLYLPIDSDPSRPDAAAQQASDDSLLHTIQKLIELRKEHPVLGSKGSIQRLNPTQQPYPLVYLREYQGKAALVAINPLESAGSLEFELSGKVGSALLGDLSVSSNGSKHTIEVPALSCGILSWEV